MSSIIRDSLMARATSSSNRLPISGKIRAGTKAITKTASQNSFALELFRKAQSGVISFKDAEKEIADKAGIKFPFFPRNTQHFNVYAHDVEGGQHVVDTMLQLYGEQREGDTEEKLYRFPIVFPAVPSVEDFFPNEFRVAQGPIKYHSSYGDDGVRRCLYLKPVDPVQQAKRKKHERRTETVRGECVPGSCPEFGSGACRFGGTLHFYIPGVTGSATFAMATGSTYAAEDIFQRLDEIIGICGGRMPMFDREGNPVFYMTKVKKTRTYFDEHGAEKRGEQWVPFVETTLQMSKVLMLAEQRRLQLAAPSAVPSVVGLPAAWLPGAMQQATAGTAADDDVGAGQIHPGATAADEQRGHSEISTSGASGGPESEESALVQFIDLAEDNGMGKVAQDWAIAKFGEDWDGDAKVPGALGELQSLLDARGAECCRGFLELCTALYVNRIPVREAAMPYLMRKYGRELTRNRQLLRAALMHVHELLESSGLEVTLAHMQANSGA